MDGHDFEYFVAPLVGAWIEILIENAGLMGVPLSLPLWERGLKFPLQVVWSTTLSRSPCGSVGARI